MPIVETAAVTGGVTTHADMCTAAALDDFGNLLGTEEFPASPAGCQALLDWLAGFGPVRLVGIDTTEAWGDRLAGHLCHAGVGVVVVEGAEGQSSHGEAVPPDAAGTARAARLGKGRALPIGCPPMLGAIEVLLDARLSAEHDRSAAVERLRALVAAAPSDLGLGLSHCSTAALIAETAALRPRPGHPVGYATRVVMRELGQQAAYFGEQIGRLDELLVPLVAAHAAGLFGVFAVEDDGELTLLAADDDEAGA
jgi:hypothetical protein